MILPPFYYPLIILQPGPDRTLTFENHATAVMEIMNANAASLSNYEVMRALQETKEATNKKFKKDSALATVTYETLRYLQDTECKNQDGSQITELLKALHPYKLTKSEKLMIINTPPRSPLEIQLIIQESEERLSEKQVEEIIKLVNDLLPPPVVEYS